MSTWNGGAYAGVVALMRGGVLRRLRTLDLRTPYAIPSTEVESFFEHCPLLKQIRIWGEFEMVCDLLLQL